MKLSFLLFLGAFSNFVSAQEDDIPTTAINAGGFETLVAALTAADLVGALSEPNGPFTVFAPTDDAFAALPEGLVSCLLLEENVGALASILTYHVVAGTVLSGDLTDGMMPETLNTETITVGLSDGVTINGATSVVTPDVAASNGVIHIIDGVLVPPSIDVAAFLETCPTEASPVPTEATPVPTDPAMGMGNETETELVDIPTTAQENGSFGTLVAALSAADLVEALAEPNGPFTVFAPTDDAFAALPDGLVDCLLEPGNLLPLTAILTYHVVEGAVLSSDLEDGMMPETLQGEALTINLGDDVTINESSTVVTADVMTSNGVIHVIDSVLVPPSIDVEAFLATCDISPDAPPTTESTAEDAGVTISTFASMLAATAVAALAL